METENAAVAIGAALKAAREARGLSIVAVSQELRIPPHYLEALEVGNWSRFPAEFYGQGFLRSYARYLGLDAEALVAQRRAMLAAQAPAPFGSGSGSGRGMPPGTMAGAPVLNGRRRGGKPLGGGAGIGVLALLVLFAGGLWLLRHHPPHPLRPPAAGAPVAAYPGGQKTTRRARPVPSPPVTASTAPPVAVVSRSGGPTVMVASPPIRVVVHFVGPCWVQAWSNGQEVDAGTLFQAGQRYAVSGGQSVTMLFGNSGAALVTVNGQTLGSLGPKGAVRTVHFEVGDTALAG
ncbi:MAG: DUF4115 domain-containing protein [Firmicutes bacterium]|nr:helix-turn-helix domain-containing protein [Alicyclobacillaceae bacterium]MCL6496846.1 DUF4115 domain-containing protein [Bacillota bacterium]